jgi:ABC-type phosphate transport system substrate-binding protein
LRAKALIALIPITIALCAAGSAEPRPPDTFQVIVHPDNPAAGVERRFLADAFLKKTTRWGNDEPIRPVDLDPASQVRQRFSDEVLHRSVAAVKSYWTQLVFSGRGVPPPELSSDDQIVSYVLTHPGSVGYVSSRATLNGAKPLVVR